jgi:hypothetical protein
VFQAKRAGESGIEMEVVSAVILVPVNHAGKAE